MTGIFDYELDELNGFILTADYADYGDFLTTNLANLTNILFHAESAEIRRKGIFGDVNKIDDCEKILRISFISA